MIDAKSLIGSHDVVMITLDTLRYDVAAEALEKGLTPNIAAVLPDGQWELRHTPGNFTYAAHQAFFAGFLPTPITPGLHPRLFAAHFFGSQTTSEQTFQFDSPTIVRGLSSRGYRTVCIGGVGFFNKQTELGRVLPGMFDESHWSESLGVTDPRSTENQIAIAVDCLQGLPIQQRLFLFINVSAMHQPNCMYVDGCEVDSAETQAAALAYVDSCLAELFSALRKRAPSLCILTSDHGTAYGEDGYWGHRVSHPVVWEVPYAEFILGKSLSDEKD